MNLDAETLSVESLVLEFLRSEQILFQDKPIDNLFQYTRNSTLPSLLKSQQIWATEFRYLNDPTEFSHGMIQFIKEFEMFLTKKLKPGSMEELVDLINFLKKEAANPSIKFFVSSFTEEKDRLSQWRGYGDFGLGLSIGFSTNSVILENAQSFWGKVIYDDLEKGRIIQKIIADFEILWDVIVQNSTANTISNDFKELIIGYINVAALFSIKFKDKAWVEEQEWRLIHLYNNQVGTSKVREGLSGFVEYFEFKLSVPFLKEIVIGPRSNFEKQNNCIEILTQKKVKISKSEIPWV